LIEAYITNLSSQHIWLRQVDFAREKMVMFQNSFRKKKIFKDINSTKHVRGGAERNAVNALFKEVLYIIKIAMINVFIND
jgi:DNA polymerase I-like protein with 3'-5' exonuclease and polymerase domains